MLNIVLVEPEIPANTGNIGRTCVITGSRLHLVGPMGFDLSDKAVQRAGLAYWTSLDLATYSSWDDFLAANPLAAASLTQPTAEQAEAHKAAGVHLLTKRGGRTYDQATYQDGDYLIFGKESSGLDAQLLESHPGLCERIPMRGDDVLANAPTWHDRYDELHPDLERDICGNFVDPRVGQITSLNLSNAVAIVAYEALRQLGFPGM